VKRRKVGRGVDDEIEKSCNATAYNWHIQHIVTTDSWCITTVLFRTFSSHPYLFYPIIIFTQILYFKHPTIQLWSLGRAVSFPWGPYIVQPPNTFWWIFEVQKRTTSQQNLRTQVCTSY